MTTIERDLLIYTTANLVHKMARLMLATASMPPSLPEVRDTVTAAAMVENVVKKVRNRDQS